MERIEPSAYAILVAQVNNNEYTDVSSCHVLIPLDVRTYEGLLKHESLVAAVHVSDIFKRLETYFYGAEEIYDASFVEDDSEMLMIDGYLGKLQTRFTLSAPLAYVYAHPVDPDRLSNHQAEFYEQGSLQRIDACWLTSYGPNSFYLSLLAKYGDDVFTTAEFSLDTYRSWCDYAKVSL